MAYNTGSVPTLAEAITGVFNPQMFSSEVLFHTMSHLVVANAFTHRFKDDLRMGYIVNIPVLSEISATEVTPGTEPTSQNAIGTPASITINKWQEASVEISPLMEIEEKADYMQNAARSAAYAIDKAIDTEVGARFSALASNSIFGSDGQTFTDEIFIGLVETLDENDVPDEGRFIIGDPSTKADMLKIDKFVRMDYINGAPTTNGKFGQLYAAQVLITNNLTAATTGNYGVYSHPDALGVVLQKNPNAKIWDLGWKFLVKIIVDAAWGSNELRDVFGKAFYTRKDA